MDKKEREWWINVSEESFSGILCGVTDQKKAEELRELPLSNDKIESVEIHIYRIKSGLVREGATGNEEIFVRNLCSVRELDEAENLLALSLGEDERRYVASHILYLKTIQKETAEAGEEGAEPVHCIDPEEYAWWWFATAADASSRAKTITDANKIRNLLKLPLPRIQLSPIYKQYYTLLIYSHETRQEKFCKEFPQNKYSFPLRKASEMNIYQKFAHENSFDSEAYHSVIKFMTSMDFLLYLLKRDSGFEYSIKKAAAERLKEAAFPELKWFVRGIKPDEFRKIVMHAVTDQTVLESLLLYDPSISIRKTAFKRVESPQIMVQALLKEKNPFVLDTLTICLEKQINKLNVDSVWRLVVRDDCLAVAIRILAKLEPEAWIEGIDEGIVKRLATFLNRTRPYPWEPPFKSSANELWYLEREQNQAAAQALVLIYYAGAHKELIFSYNRAEVIGVNEGRAVEDGEVIYINEPPEIFCVDENCELLMTQKYGEAKVKEWGKWRNWHK